MDLSDLEINIGEFVYTEGIYIFRNDHAYLVFKPLDENEHFGSILFFNEQYYCVETLMDLRSYTVEDFL